MDKLLETDISHGGYETYVPMLEEKFADMSKEEVLKRVAAMEFDRFLKYYENAEDLNVRDRVRQPWDRTERGSAEGPRDQRDDRKRDTRGREFQSNGDQTKLFVNLGTKDGFYKASFLQFILDMSDLRKEVLGRIDMKEMNSWIEVEKGAAQKMIRAIDGKNYKGRRIRMNEANSR
jgi:ATP-dependent RNA helicase DeaD